MVTRFKAAFHPKSVQNGSRDTGCSVNARDRPALLLPFFKIPMKNTSKNKADLGPKREASLTAGRQWGAPCALCNTQKLPMLPPMSTIEGYRLCNTKEPH